MKRWLKVTLVLLFCLCLWVWLYEQLTFNMWIGIPFIILILIALYSLAVILISVKKIKSDPNERVKLQEDILRAKNYYDDKGLRLRMI